MASELHKPSSDLAHQPLPDAIADNWVDLYASHSLRPWLKLGRFDRPIGIWLLYLPCAMGLSFAAAQHHQGPSALYLVLFFIGACLMRAAGCAFNDIVDRKIDQGVARTRDRPVASGRISVKSAFGFILAACLISLTILLQLGTLAIELGVGSLILVAAYPFMKRITWWPQAWLGLTFNWGFLMAYATVTKDLSVPALVFYIGLIMWTLGYDTIYALQDIEDDALIGVKSSARALKNHVSIGVRAFYYLSLILTAAAGAMARLGPLYFIGLICVAAHLFWQLSKLKPEDTGLALKLFKSNRTLGLLWVVAICLGAFIFGSALFSFL